MTTSSVAARRTVAVTGATGFVGRALVPRLVEAGYAVRRLARRPEALTPLEEVDDRRFDLDDPEPDADAMAGVDTVFYMVHSMSAGPGFADRDRAYAHRFATAARAAGVRHVIYLGGLYPREPVLSQHLASRREVGEILQRECGGLHVRAGIIIGSGSASFEIMLDLVTHLPAMITPRWVGNRCQAVELSDALEALVRAVDVPGNRQVDLVGPDVLTYREMLERMAHALGLRRRLIVGVPVLTPRLSAHWLRFVTSVSLPVAQALVESLRHDAIADGTDLCAEVGIEPCGFDGALRRALANRPRIVGTTVESAWDGRRCNLAQRFQLSAATHCDQASLARIDRELHQLTPWMGLRLLSWRGDDLRLAGRPMLRLGPPRYATGTRQRSIEGGWLAAEAGGVLWFSCEHGRQGPVIAAGVSGYAPRLPRIAYLLVQARLHRALVTSAVRRALSADSPRPRTIAQGGGSARDVTPARGARPLSRRVASGACRGRDQR